MQFIRRVFRFYQRLFRLLGELENIPSYFRWLNTRLDDLQLLMAQSMIKQREGARLSATLTSYEYKVFSQFGDDGIIQFLIKAVEIPPAAKNFIEFGVENYVEANTRFLLAHDNWRGLVFDGSQANVDFIQKDPLYWKHELIADCAFIDRDNINALIAKHDFEGEIGILSIDIDGNDYWVWEAIHQVDPILVTIEYNSVFGIERSVVTPYDSKFNKTTAHFSNLFWGASLKAIHSLAYRKGYRFLGSDSAGNNAYFVRKDKLGNLREVSLEEGYVLSRFRESRDAEGKLTYITGAERLRAIAHLNLYDVEKGENIPISELAAWDRASSASSTSLRPPRHAINHA